MCTGRRNWRSATLARRVTNRLLSVVVGTHRTRGMDGSESRLSDLLRIPAFSVVFAAEVQSLVGDQLARVALSVLVFDRTSNVAATSATYAMTFLPAIVGGAVLARIGDQLSRRSVMVGCDLLRAAAFGVLALPGVPLWALIALVVLAVLFEPVFSAAQVAYLADELEVEQFRASTGLRMASQQIAQVAGFAVGGVIVAAIEPRGALLVNAATFLVSSILIGALLPTHRRRPERSTDERAADARRAAAECVSPWREQRMRLLLALTTLAGLFVVPEGLAVPLVAQLNGSAVVAGLLLAAIPLGGAVGALFLIRLVRPPRRESVSGQMAVACGLLLVITAAQPPWPVVLLAWFLSGAASAYQVEVITEIARSAPERRRSRVVGVAAGWLATAQGVGLLTFGGLAQPLGAATSIAVAGASGSFLALAVVIIRGSAVGSDRDSRLAATRSRTGEWTSVERRPPHRPMATGSSVHRPVPTGRAANRPSPVTPRDRA